MIEIFSSNQICPNVTEFQVKGSYRGEYSFYASVEFTAAGLAYNGTHFAYTTDVSRNFNADEYRKNGFQTPVSATDDGFAMNRDGTMIYQKLLSKTDVNYFNFSWLDTSSISMFDFGESFENYQVESSSLRVETLYLSTKQEIKMEYS